MGHAKQQAVMFLLGALLVGGALGFSADRYIRHQSFTSQYGPLRSRFYDDLGLSEQQRATIDSLAFQQDCAMKALLAPQRAAMDSIRTRFHAEIDSVFSPAQMAKLNTRRAEIKARRDAEQAKEPKRQCSGT